MVGGKIKKLITIEADRITCRGLKKGQRQMVTCHGRLYRTDDAFMIRDYNGSDAWVIYDLDGTQPYANRARFVDPDMTRALIDSAKLSGTRKHIWGNIGGHRLTDLLTVIVVVGALLWGFLSGVI